MCNYSQWVSFTTYNTSWAWKICKCFSFCVVSFMLICFPSVLCCFYFCTPPFCRFRVCFLDFALSLDSVVFWIIPLPCSFGMLLTIYEVQWNNDVNTYVDFFTLTTSCEAPHYSSIMQTHINYRIYKSKARLVNWTKNVNFFFFKTIDLGLNVL